MHWSLFTLINRRMLIIRVHALRFKCCHSSYSTLYPFWERTYRKTTLPLQLVLDHNRQLQSNSGLSTTLSSQRSAQYPNEHWKQIRESMRLTATATQDSRSCKSQKQWIPSISVALLSARRFVIRIPQTMSSAYPSDVK